LPEKAAGETAMKITVSRPINGISVNGDEFLLDESGELLVFETVQEALRYFAERNCNITDLLDFYFHFEEPEETLCAPAPGGRKETWPLARRKRA
jgi:hypothetical protein